MLFRSVFVPLDAIIGGVPMAGHGWRMLIEQLSVGRCISLPASATGGAVVAAWATGAYARIRRQFSTPVGRFEGVDERAIEARGLEEISIGDYVLSGGEIAAMVLLDACVRLIPGVMGKEASGAEESFESGLLEYPHYTRPRAWEGREIPDVLLSGDHAKIARWRREEAERITRERRPDLLKR